MKKMISFSRFVDDICIDEPCAHEKHMRALDKIFLVTVRGGGGVGGVYSIRNVNICVAHKHEIVCTI